MIHLRTIFQYSGAMEMITNLSKYLLLAVLSSIFLITWNSISVGYFDRIVVIIFFIAILFF